MDRRSFLKVSAAGGTVVLSGMAGAQFAGASSSGRKVYVVVLDGLRPDEVTPALMPKLTALKQEGAWFPNARSMPVAETIPNHVMMMSGIRPDRSGVPANSVFDGTEVRTLDRPSDWRGGTLLGRLRNELGLKTGSVLSKEYLYGIFGTKASYRWEPSPIVPISGHAPDQFTKHALFSMVDEADPDLVFVNFGECDRAGHTDLTGGSLAVLRRLAVRQSDGVLGDFVEHLKERGVWHRSVLFVLADHSMDWSTPGNIVNLNAHIKKDAKLAGKVVIAQNGGADLLYYTGPAADRSELLSRLVTLVKGVEGVRSVHSPRTLRLGSRGGDLVAYCEQGWRFSDDDPWSNPIPGNHGHPTTQPIPFLIAGGDPIVRRGAAISTRAHTIDVAPTVSKLFGLSAPAGGYDGAALTEAFTKASSGTA